MHAVCREVRNLLAVDKDADNTAGLVLHHGGAGRISACGVICDRESEE
jgi:hypothetical protein